ncbi:siderophore-interacting protein [Kocuria soli]|uniref:Siderophore-interacting protein n=1 Tax=Kocuria soli TaxID=2485125 RepID=A0A3N3ZWB6_9MICC|nr:siderophore-interacting protein [Kocuria soli]ROZ65683.1 siderophore-interacting protein [Kocuria soli]
MSAAAQPVPVIACAEVEVTGVEDLSPTFRRVRLAGPELAEFSRDLIGDGDPVACRDAYLKLLLPPEGTEPTRPDLSMGYRGWFALPQEQRGYLRTYTARSARWVELRGQVVPEVTLDFVLHAADQGPGGRWAANARPGDRTYLLGPGPGESPWSAWGSGRARRIVAVGDETAVPALLSIVEELQAEEQPIDADVIMEVPLAEDLPLAESSPSVRVHALPRSETGAHGTGSVRELAHVLDLPTFCVADVLAGRRPERAVEATATEATPLWEIADPRSERDTYVFLAGEAASVKAWRRLCVDAAGIPKQNVSFMGYWRRGQAES